MRAHMQPRQLGGITVLPNPYWIQPWLYMGLPLKIVRKLLLAQNIAAHLRQEWVARNMQL